MSSTKVTEEFGTQETPTYNLMSKDMMTSLTVASTLFVITVGTMVAMADTFIAESVLWMYNTASLLGVLVMSAVIGYGGKTGMDGLINGDTTKSIFGTMITISAFGAFGGAVLTTYEAPNYMSGIIGATVASLAIASISTMYVVKSGHSFENWRSYAGKIFLIGMIPVLLGTFIPGTLGSMLIMVAFALFIIGFIVDFTYEVWHMVSGSRKPAVNGFGVYFSFTGIFVHLLQFFGDG